MRMGIATPGRMRTPAVLGPLAVLAFIVFVPGCGGGAPGEVGNSTPYTSDPGKTVVVGGPEAGGAAQTIAANGCVKLASGACVEAKACAPEERRDVVIDTAGKVVAVVCYPADADALVIDAKGDVTLDKNQNNGVVRIDGNDDGIDVTGNVASSGNNVVVYGQGAGVSVIGGNVSATGNNFSMRGVTIKGNVEIGGGNNAVLVLCRVEGNVKIVGNNGVIAGCDILGNVEIEGNNTTLVGNHIGGTITLGNAKNTVCDANTKWSDANANKTFEGGEAGELLKCEGK